MIERRRGRCWQSTFGRRTLIAEASPSPSARGATDDELQKRRRLLSHVADRRDLLSVSITRRPRCQLHVLAAGNTSRIHIRRTWGTFSLLKQTNSSVLTLHAPSEPPDNCRYATHHASAVLRQPPVWSRAQIEPPASFMSFLTYFGASFSKSSLGRCPTDRRAGP